MKLVFGLLVVCLLLFDVGRSVGADEKAEENVRAKRDTLTGRFMSFVCGKLCSSAAPGGCFAERICGPWRRKFT